MARLDIQQSVPSHLRTVPGSVNIRAACLPTPSKVVTLDPDRVAFDLVDIFNLALDQRNYHKAASLFADNGFWRDHLALSWQLRTVHGHDAILKFMEKKCSASKDGMRLRRISVDQSSAVRAPQACVLDGAGEVRGIQFFFQAETVHGSAVGIARLAMQHDAWKIFTFFTGLQELKGHEELLGHRRPMGAEHGGHPDRKNWAEKRLDSAAYNDNREPTVIIIGKMLLLTNRETITDHHSQVPDKAD